MPYRIHTVLTDNGIQFTNRARDAHISAHIFRRVCDEHGIEHRLTKVNHLWTSGQVERVNRAIKEATIRRYHYADHDQLRTHLRDFLDAYNFARRLKTLGALTAYEFICKLWASKPRRFRLDPTHQMPGLNTQNCFSYLYATLVDSGYSPPLPRSFDDGFAFPRVTRGAGMTHDPMQGRRRSTTPAPGLPGTSPSYPRRPPSKRSSIAEKSLPFPSSSSTNCQ